MSQSAFIAGGLIALFVLWLAAKNRLSAYTATLWGQTESPNPTGNVASSSSSSSGGGGFLGGLFGGGGSGASTAATAAEVAAIVAL